MAIPTFFHNDVLEVSTEITLSDQEGSHAVKSRRLELNSKVQITNGRGDMATGYLSSIKKRQVSIVIEEIEHSPKVTPRLIIATAIPKGDRQKVMIDMLTQFGITHIIPLSCEFSITRFNDNMQAKWQRVMIEACKQSHRSRLPELMQTMYVTDCIRHFKSEEAAIMYADKGSKSISELSLPVSKDRVVLIGPEGGFSESELLLLRDHCFPVCLGRHILRTETAAVAAASAIAVY